MNIWTRMMNAVDRWMLRHSTPDPSDTATLQDYRDRWTEREIERSNRRPKGRHKA